jgi:hypothetical protein
LRIDRLAEAAGKTSHDFMVDALSQTAESMGCEQAFEAEVNRRRARYAGTRKVISLQDMRDDALALAAGKCPPRPKARKLDVELHRPESA